MWKRRHKSKNLFCIFLNIEQEVTISNKIFKSYCLLPLVKVSNKQKLISHNNGPPILLLPDLSLLEFFNEANYTDIVNSIPKEEYEKRFQKLIVKNEIL